MHSPKLNVAFLEDAAEFLDCLEEKARDKIIYNINKARFSDDKELFKKLRDEIWEFRTLFNKSHYRLFAFWDKSEDNRTMVIATHGLMKKTDKTPKGALNEAKRMRNRYLELKAKNK